MKIVLRVLVAFFACKHHQPLEFVQEADVIVGEMIAVVVNTSILDKDTVCQ